MQQYRHISLHKSGEPHIPHNSTNNVIGMKLLWGLMILASAGLFVIRCENNARGNKTLVPWIETTVVNATNSDGPKDGEGSDRDSSPQEMHALRDRIRLLETEVATLKRQNRVLER